MAKDNSRDVGIYVETHFHPSIHGCVHPRVKYLFPWPMTEEQIETISPIKRFPDLEKWILDFYQVDSLEEIDQRRYWNLRYYLACRLNRSLEDS